MPPSKLITLRVRAPDGATAIRVLDSTLNQVNRDDYLGEATFLLMPGAYVVQFRRGDGVTEKVTFLPPTEDVVTVEMSESEAPRFSTAVPVRGTSTTREFHREPARVISMAVPRALRPRQQGGTHLFVFVRDLDRESRGNPARTLTLHDIHGERVCDLEVECERDEIDQWAAVHLEVEPGAYRIRQARRRGFMEQIVCTQRNWQTQVFLLTEQAGREEASRRPDLRSMSVLMARPSDGFDFERADVRWTEVALRALGSTALLTADIEDELFLGKLENPMLGIYAALLHLRRKELTPKLIDVVIPRLFRLFDEPIPDLIAIAAAAVRRSPRAADAPFAAVLRDVQVATPPMLRESWRHLIDASEMFPGLIADDSLADEVSESLVDSGPWLAWLDPGPVLPSTAKGTFDSRTLAGIAPQERRRPGEKQAEDLEGILQSLQAALTSPGAEQVIYSPALTPIERSLAEVINPMVDPMLREIRGLSDRTRERIDSAYGPPAALLVSESTGLTRAAMRRVGLSLLEKLDL